MTGREERAINPRIDPGTAEKVHAILMLCRSRGQDPVQVLDLGGFLRYPARKRQDLLTFLDDIIIPVIKEMRSDGTLRTPLDMRNWIIESLEGFRNDLQAEDDLQAEHEAASRSTK